MKRALHNLRRQLRCRCGSNPYVNTCSNCPPGLPGNNGTSFAFTVTVEPPGANCLYGGSFIQGGPDLDGDGIPDSITASTYVCNGAPGGVGRTPSFAAGTATPLPFGDLPYIEIVAGPPGFDYQVNIGLPAGPQGVPGPEQLFWGRTAFVDDQYGNNVTGVVGDATKPFQTIQKANDMLISAGWVGSGLRGVIYVRNGSYTTTTGVTLDRWIDIHGDSFTILCNNVANPAITFLGESHIIAPGASIAHTVVGGKALYAVGYYTGRIFVNKIVGAIDINLGGSTAEINVRDVLPTMAVNSPNGFGDVASGNIVFNNGNVDFTSVNCWSSVRLTTLGTACTLSLKGNFKNGVWGDQNAIIELVNARITRRTAAVTATVIFLDNNAKLRSYASKVEGLTIALKCITLVAAATKAYLSATVLVSFGGQPTIIGDPAAEFYNLGGSSANVAPTTPSEPLIATQPLYVNALVS